MSNGIVNAAAPNARSPFRNVIEPHVAVKDSLKELDCAIRSCVPVSSRFFVSRTLLGDSVGTWLRFPNRCGTAEQDPQALDWPLVQGTGMWF